MASHRAAQSGAVARGSAAARNAAVSRYTVSESWKRPSPARSSTSAASSSVTSPSARCSRPRSSMSTTRASGRSSAPPMTSTITASSSSSARTCRLYVPKARQTCQGKRLKSGRSEEHTSELQSRLHLVCRLLLDTPTTEIYTLSLHDALPIYLTQRQVQPAEIVDVDHPRLGALLGAPDDLDDHGILLLVRPHLQALCTESPSDMPGEAAEVREIGRAHV